MATRKRSNKKKAKKVTPKKKAPKKLAKKSATPGKKSAKKAPSKRAAVKTKVAAQKKTASKARAPKKRVAAHRQSVDAEALVREGGTARSGGQSGDLQGLSNIAGANSESVDELLEEGNAFEADVVKGVEDAGDEGEVRTHEVSEDDVPEEYLEKD
jgi:hypothetical protein